MRRFFRLFVISLACCLFTLIGCSNPDAKYAKVEGVVTYNQQPVEGATLTFLPATPGSGLEAAAGFTDASGKFSLTSSGAIQGGAGVLPGEYVVLISKETFPPDPDAEKMDQGLISVEEYAALTSRKPEPAPIQHLPGKYAEKNKTDLKASVKPGKNPPFQFDLTD